VRLSLKTSFQGVANKMYDTKPNSMVL